MQVIEFIMKDHLPRFLVGEEKVYGIYAMFRNI